MTIAADFEELYKTYAALAERLSKAFETSCAEEVEAAAATVLLNREYLNRIEQMNARVLQLSSDWQKDGAFLDPGIRDQAEYFIAAARAQALRLKEICDVHAQKLQRARARVLKEMAEIGKGTRLLKSLKPVKTNYPKFIDSRI